MPKNTYTIKIDVLIHVVHSFDYLTIRRKEEEQEEKG
jgi:hypothetical protein